MQREALVRPHVSIDALERRLRKHTSNNNPTQRLQNARLANKLLLHRRNYIQVTRTSINEVVGFREVVGLREVVRLRLLK